MRGFASDNYASVHPAVMRAIEEANHGHAIAYGDDDITRRCVKKFKELLGENIEVYFVYNGTAANVLGLSGLVQSHNAIICAETSHLNTDECGAPEKFTGCKLLTVPTTDGKITVEQIEKHMHGFGDEHHVQPRAISITQATEYGTVYTTNEMAKISDFAIDNNMLVHVDGARWANAMATLGWDEFSLFAANCIDVLSFGGTKNGMMYGEAIIFFHKVMGQFKFIRKQGMQLASKMRFISVQFEALLIDNLWLGNANHANNMAKLLAQEMRDIPSVMITQKVEANAVFCDMPNGLIEKIREEYFFYTWKEGKHRSEIRLMTSFDTIEDDVSRLVELIRKSV